MIRTKLALLIVGFAFSTAAMAAVTDGGVATTPSTIKPSDCPYVSTGTQNSSWKENRQAAKATAYDLVNGRGVKANPKSNKTTF